MMKGVVIERALPGNVLDVYSLFKEAIKQGAMAYPKPTEDQVKGFYFTLLDELALRTNVILLARSRKQYVGYIHCSLVQRPFGPAHVAFIKGIFVTEKRRKNGIAQGLRDALFGALDQMGITTKEFLCHDDLVPYFEKKHGAKKVLNYMMVEKA